MRLGLLTSNQIRHKYLAQVLSQNHELALIVSEKRNYESQILASTEEDTRLLQDHFNLLEKAQVEYFGNLLNFPSTQAEIVEVESGCVNTPEIADKIKRLQLEGLAVFGPGILKPLIFEATPGPVINIHQGLSPYYRGSGTNFWPFVEKQLQYVGVTVHYIDPGIDTGGIICHGRPTIEMGDTMHRIGCKVVEISAQLLSRVFIELGKGTVLAGIPQWGKGKLYLKRHFSAEAVRVARENIRLGLIENYVNSAANGTLPRIQVVELA